MIEENYAHPLVDGLNELPAGFTTIDRVLGGLAMDYIRGNLFEPGKMIALPFDVPGPDNDLNEKIDYHVQRALAEEDADQSWFSISGDDGVGAGSCKGRSYRANAFSGASDSQSKNSLTIC